MSPAEALLGFTAAAAVLTVLPGLDTALVLRAAAVEGPKRAALAGLGIAIGCLVWGAAVAVGLGALLAASHLAFTLLKWAGAAYLLWLGIGLISRPRKTFDMEAVEGAPIGDDFAWMRRGLTTNLLNPKIGVFYVSFLPQFMAQGVPAGPFLMLLALGVRGLVYGFSNMAGDKQQSPVSPVKTAAPIYEESPPGAPATGEGGPASVPVPPAAAPALPVLEYHGWTSYGGRPEFLLCQPAAPAAQSGLGSPDEGPTGPGCAVELHWSDVAHYRLVGSRIIVQAGPDGPDLWQIVDPGFVLDLTRAGHRLANR